MGTNYYLIEKQACEHCGRHIDRGLHIGKSSSGWTFGLRIYPDEKLYGQERADVIAVLGRPGVRGIDDWFLLFDRYGIVDEYGDVVPSDVMMRTITERSHPNGLLRRHGLGRHMRVEFPEGVTFDLVDGEFS